MSTGLLERLGKHLCDLDVGNEGHAEVHGEAADGVVCENALGELVGEHEHEVNVATRNGLVDAVVRHVVGIDIGRGVGELLDLDAFLFEEFGRLFGRKEGVAQRCELLKRGQRLLVALALLDGDENVLAGQLHAGRHHRLEEGVVRVRAEAGHFARGRHLHAERGVGALQALEGEHRRLDAHEALLGPGALHRLELLVAAHGARGRLDEVHAEALGREREGARRTQVALDHLDGAVLGNELHVEGPGDLESLGHLVRNLLDLLERLGGDRLRRQDQCRVA
mmetsp:Transcript_32053/g.83928  ORF Transcript_32053/g.83928 Transcript_32053/m.83928 type:complete len:280 (-) Transcript_32053:494-1333(-)